MASASSVVSAHVAASSPETMYALTHWWDQRLDLDPTSLGSLGHSFVFYQVTGNPEVATLLGEGGGAHSGLNPNMWVSFYVSDISGGASRPTLFTRDEAEKFAFVLSTMGHETCYHRLNADKVHSGFPVDMVVICSGKFTPGEKTSRIFTRDKKVRSCTGEGDELEPYITLGGTWSSEVKVVNLKANPLPRDEYGGC